MLLEEEHFTALQLTGLYVGSNGPSAFWSRVYICTVVPERLRYYEGKSLTHLFSYPL